MFRLFGLLLTVGFVLQAQHPSIISPGRTTPAPAGAFRFGNILFPGGLPKNQSHAARLGGTIAGRPPFVGVQPGHGHGRGHQRNRTLVVPYAVPVYYGDPYGYGYAQQSPNVTVVVPQQPAPSVVINHNYTPETANPVMRDYSNSNLPESGGLRVYDGSKPSPKEPAQAPVPEAKSKVASDQPTIYLIALKDSTIRQAIGYWIEDETFNYVTPQGTINRVSLDNLDKELSERLNAERNLEFDLNSARR